MVLFAMITATVIVPASANEIAELKKQLELLAQKVEILEQKRDQKLQANSQLTPVREQRMQAIKEPIPVRDISNTDYIPGSWLIPGTDTSMSISGFIRAHMIYDLAPRPTSAGGDVASIRRAILEGTPEYQNRGDLRIAGRDARFNLETFTPTELGQMHTYIQADFKGDPDNKGRRATTNRTAANIRHAYAELGNFLMGHTYSAYLDRTVFGDKVDATGPQGRTMIRQGQVRYTHHYDEEREFVIALENPHADFINADDDNLHDGYPDLAMHYRHETGGWSYQFGGMFRRMGIKQVVPFPADDEVFSWGLNHSGMYWFPGGKDRLTWYINFGDGIGRYLESGADQGASITADGKLDTQFGYGGFITYKHWWTETISSNFDFGMSAFDLNPDEDPEANKRLLSSHLNLIWTPHRQLEFGLEYVWGKRKVHDGRTGDVSRLQVNSIFNF